MKDKITINDKKLAELYVSIFKTYKSENDMMINMYGIRADYFRKEANKLLLNEPFKIFKKTHIEWENKLIDLWNKEKECYLEIEKLMNEYVEILNLHKCN